MTGSVSAMPLPGIYLHKRNEGICPHKDLGLNVYSFSIYNGPKLKTTEGPSTGRKDKQMAGSLSIQWSTT